MNVVHAKCAGLDVHKESVVACVRLQDGSKVQRDTKSFGATTSQLGALSEWLLASGCTHVAMEATGVYWKPVWHVLEGSFTLILANAGHVKNVPGRKTDVKDAEWIADLLAHGLIKASFVAEKPIQEVRDLTRTRKQLVQEAARHIQRLQKTLEDANVKLSSVVADIMGATGRAVIEAIIAGEHNPRNLLKLKDSRIHASDQQFVEALLGRITPHHQFLLELHLNQIDVIRSSITSIDEQLEKILEPFRERVELLRTIPGIDRVLAAVIVGEVGTDMANFPTSQQLVSWAGLCPKNDESAGKRRSTRLRKGGTWLKPHLIQGAWGAIRKKDSYFRSQYHRIRARRGAKKAIVAVAASMLTAVYYILRDRVPYRDLGPAHFDRLHKARAVNRLVRRLGDLGYNVALEPKGTAA
jgi:transposase